ncbi:MAG TPA: hypothetical protein VLH10_27395, partial [Yinghuangia sp.]|nr:hypothetical protein [Yinghuangia sp.]
HLVPATEPVRTIGPEDWRATGTPLLRHPRSLVKRLHDLHRPETGTAIVAVLDADERPVASASFAIDTDHGVLDGWECRNIILAHLRLIVPDDLRRATPSRTTVLLVCRDGERGWEPADGRWMWGLRDACGLHGLRCGAVVVSAEDGWQVVGDGRGGRTPVPVPPRAPTPLPVAPEPAPHQAPAETAPRPEGTPGIPSPRTEQPGPPSRLEPPGMAAATSVPDDQRARDRLDELNDVEPPVGRAVVRLVPDVTDELQYSSA